MFLAVDIRAGLAGCSACDVGNWEPEVPEQPGVGWGSPAGAGLLLATPR